MSVRADHKRADEKSGGGDETATKTKAPFRSSIKSHSTEVLRKLCSVTHISRARRIRLIAFDDAELSVYSVLCIEIEDYDRENIELNFFEKKN